MSLDLRPVVQWRQGGDFQLALWPEVGQFSGDENITAHAKAIATRFDDLPGGAAVIDFALTWLLIPAAEESPAYWQGSVDSLIGEGLSPGFFALDARVEAGSGVIQIPPITVELLERVTGGDV